MHSSPSRALDSEKVEPPYDGQVHPLSLGSRKTPTELSDWSKNAKYTVLKEEGMHHQYPSQYEYYNVRLSVVI